MGQKDRDGPGDMAQEMPEDGDGEKGKRIDDGSI